MRGKAMIDAHIHIFQYKNVKERIEQWIDAGIQGVVAVSNNLASSYQTLELKEQFPDFIKVAVGYHPEQSPMKEQERTELYRLIQTERKLISAIGEVGLPYYHLQQLSYDEQLLHLEHFKLWVDLSVEMDLPIVIHAVHTETEKALKVLKESRQTKVHFHWLKAPDPIIKEAINLGYYLSVTPEVCYRQRDQLFVEKVPISQLLIETDGPWPFNGPFQHVDTSPLFLMDIIKALSVIYNKTEQKLIKATTDNANYLYR